jgi:hypothetical protein
VKEVWVCLRFETSRRAAPLRFAERYKICFF